MHVFCFLGFGFYLYLYHFKILWQGVPQSNCTLYEEPTIIKWLLLFLIQGQSNNYLLFSPFDPLLTPWSFYCIIPASTIPSHLIFHPMEAFFQPSDHIWHSFWLLQFYNVQLEIEDSEFHAVFKMQLNHRFTQWLNTDLWFALHSFSSHSKPQFTSFLTETR